MMTEAVHDPFTQKRIELMFEVANKKVMSEVQLLRKMVTQLENELVDLRKKINDNHRNDVRIERVQTNAEPMKAQVQQVQSHIKPEQTKSADAPRFGKYTSEDVSIEKFFNCSGKR